VTREEIEVRSRPVLSHASDAVKAAGYLFVAGLLPVDGEGAVVGDDDVVAQAEHVLAALGAVLDAGGCTYADVAKVSVYLTDVADRAAINPVRRRLFGRARPASTLVEVSALAVPGAKIEIDAIAVVP
jgi:enamine deaminase RidA (YjgF/YER057c/UK114 family)